MVTPAGTPLHAGRLRPLNAPRPVEVRLSAAGEPAAVRLGRGVWEPVTVRERWRLDDEWWRPAPIERHYYAVTLHHGARLTLYRDAVTDTWHEQG